ncbi:MAG: hypothetical protein AMJ61_00165 [Desulfobacterales bacterium SG8_35_2]|nr:MAG: hypothetical protein AMJ61_00165 [Desulfobacterales bacterium SG8_35_2]
MSGYIFRLMLEIVTDSEKEQKHYIRYLGEYLQQDNPTICRRINLQNAISKLKLKICEELR